MPAFIWANRAKSPRAVHSICWPSFNGTRALWQALARAPPDHSPEPTRADMAISTQLKRYPANHFSDRAELDAGRGGITEEASVRETIVRNLRKRIQSYADLIAAIDSADLGARLAVPKDKSVAEHLWCIVGARESYAVALAAGEWQGFSCSLATHDRASFEQALAASGEALLAAIAGVDQWSSSREELLAAVSEHEVMHEGQVIRHMYGLGRELPASWRWA